MNKAKNMIQQARKLILVAVFAMVAMIAFAQTGPPPPPGGGTSDSNRTEDNKLGANIGGGVLILLALGLAYGGKKIYPVM